MTTIRVYNGGGSIKASVALMIERLQSNLDADIRPIESSEILSGMTWAAQTDVVLFAGASVRGFKTALGKNGLSNLYNAVADNGVTYCGVCAGAAFAASHIVYNVHENNENKKLQNTGLGFFNGYARGPIKAITHRPFENSLDDIHVVNIRRTNGAALKGAYWSGPMLIPHEDNQPAQNFQSMSFLEGTDIPLSSTGTHGNGKVVLYSYHPEIASWNFRRWIIQPNPTIFQQAKLNQMDAHLNGECFDYFIQDLGLSHIQTKKAAGLNLAALL
jgi:glutamine amidotransferase-like uncharacterized protein